MPFVVIGLMVLALGCAAGYLQGYWAGRRAEFAKWEPAIEPLLSGELQYAKVQANRIADGPLPSPWEAFSSPRPKGGDDIAW